MHRTDGSGHWDEMPIASNGVVVLDILDMEFRVWRKGKVQVDVRRQVHWDSVLSYHYIQLMDRYRPERVPQDMNN